MDPLAAVLAIPGALKATLDAIEKFALRSPEASPDAQSNMIVARENVHSIREALYHFTFVTVDLRPWKHAHHCTNLIIHSEMTALFKWSQHDIANYIKTDPRRMELELEKAHLRDTSANYIRQFSNEDLDLCLPTGLQSIVGDISWYNFILQSREGLEAAFSKADGKSFFRVMKTYRDFVIPLNDAADRQLLLGLQKISERLDDTRRLLSADPGNAPI